MAVDPYQSSMSVEEYLVLDSTSSDGRYEFIDGAVTLLAGGTVNHSRISITLLVLLDRALPGRPYMVYNSDMRVSISATRYLYPDVSISCDPRDQEHGESDTVRYPSVIIEVLSPSTETYDRSKKFDYYRSSPTLQEYVLVDTQQRAVDLYRRQTENLWTFHPFRQGDEIELKSSGFRIPLASVYENIVFTEDQPD
ncbi:MAG: Uma2 family endonuclease [Ktedonobacteraceae bacterium]|nr:Uma2 family endonuclease [Chloroflexota bacterium]